MAEDILSAETFDDYEELVEMEEMEETQQPEVFESEYFALEEDEQKLLGHLVDKKDEYYDFLEYSRLDEIFYRSFKYQHQSLEHAGVIVHQGKEKEHAIVRIPRLRNNTQHLHVMTTKRRTKFEPVATNSDYKSLSQTIVLGGGLLDYYMRDKRVDRYLRKANYYALAYGEGFISIEWGPYAGRIVNKVDIDPMTQEPVEYEQFEGEIVIDVFTPMDIIRDIYAKSYDESMWIIKRKFVNKHVLAGEYQDEPEKANHIQDLVDSDTNTENNIDFNMDYYNTMSGEEVIPVYTFYHKPCSILPRGKTIKFVEGKILEITDLEYKKIPVYREAPSDIDGIPFGYSQVFDMMIPQEQVDFLWSAVVSNHRLFSEQTILVPENTNTKFQRIGNGYNFLKYTPGGPSGDNKPEAFTLLNTPPEITNAIDRLEREMDIIAGLAPGVSHGELPTAGSSMAGNALFLLESRAIEFNNMLQASHVALMEDTGTAIIDILKVKATEPRNIRIAGKAKENLIETFKGEDLHGIERIIVNVGNPAMDTTAMRLQIADKYLDLGAITVEQHQHLLETGELELLFEANRNEQLRIRAENEELEEIVQSITPEQEFQARQVWGMATKTGQDVPYGQIFTILGIRVQAMITDKHVAHILQHAGASSMPNVDPKLRWIHQMHIQHHIELLRQTDPGLLAILQQPSLAMTAGGVAPPVMPQGGDEDKKTNGANGQDKRSPSYMTEPEKPQMPQDMLTGQNPGNLDEYNR